MTQQHIERRLAVILVADIAGYSRLMGDDEEGTLVGLQKQRFSIIDPTIGHFQGRIVKSMGDGLLVEFQSITAALDCALAIQKALKRRNQDVSEDKRIRWRIGINMGEILVEEGDVYGDGVNIAARLEQVADPDGIAISSAVHNALNGRNDLKFDDLGAHRFKNIAQPVRVYHLSADPAASPSKAAFRPFVDMPEGDSVVASGGCLCGHIRYEATQPPLGSMLCHCSICRKFSGAPILGGTTFLTESITFTKAQPSFYRSSSIAKRGFCPKCGASISYHGTVGQWASGPSG